MFSVTNKFIIGVVALMIIIVGAYVLYRADLSSEGTSTTSSLPENREEGLEYEIFMTDDGFSPENLTIYEKQTIKFTNKKEKDFWPASNFHPTHTLYSAFDSLKPVPSGESWPFTFKEPGEYRYHDHLFPSANGIITVLALDGSDSVVGLDNCILGGDTSDPKCWDVLIQEGWKEGGIKGGFEAVSYLYENEPAFLNDSCHRYAHVVGDFAYEKFYPDRENYKDWEFPPETVSCGYGFYHGLFEHLFREDRNPTLAANICDTLTEKLSDQFPAIRRNCYHGIGHGFMPESPPKEIWGKPLEMTQDSLSICGNISSVKEEVYECYQGVFNVIADWVDFKNFDLEPNLEDPFWICKNQKNAEYESACYYEFAMRVPNYVDMDLKVVSDKFIGDMEDDLLAGVIIHSAAATVAERNMSKDTLVSFALECREIQERLQTDCIQGLAGGLVAHGEPEKEYIKAVDFCGSSLLNEKEKDTCYNNILNDLSASYTDKQMKTTCSYIKEGNYKDECRERFN